MANRVRRTAQAVADVDEIWLSIAIDNERAADRVIARIYEAEARFAEYPELGRTRAELGSTVRSWAVEPYVIFYAVESDAVVILRILHGARDLGDLIPDA